MEEIFRCAYSKIADLDKLGPSLYKHHTHTNEFWKDFFCIYERIRYKIKPQTAEELLAEPLFLNDEILVENKPIYYQTWVRKEIYSIGHLVHETGEIYTYEQFTQQYNVRTNALTYLGCIQAVKKYIKTFDITIENNDKLLKPISLSSICKPAKGTKVLYDILTSDEKFPNACEKWEKTIAGEINWRACFEKIVKIQEIKLRWFQIRILHRILATNIVLKEMKVVPNNSCSFCNNERESIKHLFWDCQHSQTFWKELENYISKNCENSKITKFDEKLVILGTNKNCKNDYVFEYI